MKLRTTFATWGLDGGHLYYGTDKPISHQRRSRMRLGVLAGAVCISIVGMVAPSMPRAGALSGQNHPWVVVMCKFTDRQAEPHDAAYYSDMFSETGAGKGGA